MKTIITFLKYSFVVIVALAGFAEGSAMPLLALVLFFLCYKGVFEGGSPSDKEYDPVDYVPDDFDYR
tara:strand:+ start:261 stop:461 length:201 start_codon:yes stop_codon:yes gene_type:complete